MNIVQIGPSSCCTTIDSTLVQLEQLDYALFFFSICYIEFQSKEYATQQEQLGCYQR